MARSRSAGPRSPSPFFSRPVVSPERFQRLCRLVRLLADRPQARDVLTRRLGVDVRGFYRDLEILRAAGVTVSLSDRRYSLVDGLEDALARLPYPDPLLTLGEARLLARGATPAHRKLQVGIERATK